MDVSIIIVNYRSSALVNDCIKSIHDKAGGVDYEIIVVDNNTEDLGAVISRHDDDGITLLQLPENVGFGRANNAGARVARGRNLFFLNPDTLLINNAVKILSDYLDGHPECGACGGNLYTRDLRPMHSYRIMMPGILDSIDTALARRLSLRLYGDNHEFNHTGSEMQVGYVTGADLMIPASLFTQVGGFDERYFMFYEETDLCRRIADRGHKVMSVPSARIIHLQGQSYDADRRRINLTPFVYEGQSRRIYLYSHHSWIGAGISRLILKMYYGGSYIIHSLWGERIYKPQRKTEFVNA